MAVVERYRRINDSAGGRKASEDGQRLTGDSVIGFRPFENGVSTYEFLQ